MAKPWTERIERQSFPSSNEWGMPDSKHIPLSTLLPDQFISYGEEKTLEPQSKGLHFFTYDFKFNVVWTQPLKALSRVKKFQCCLSPDFSMYLDMPRAEQIWNTYRNRWVAAFWEENDVLVIPTIGWSDPNSYSYSFAGVPTESVVAISTVGVHKDLTTRSFFKDGFRAMIQTLQPSLILCYGTKLEDVHDFDKLNILYYPQYWHRRTGRRPKEAKIQFQNSSTLPF